MKTDLRPGTLDRIARLEDSAIRSSARAQDRWQILKPLVMSDGVRRVESNSPYPAVRGTNGWDGSHPKCCREESPCQAVTKAVDRFAPRPDARRGGITMRITRRLLLSMPALIPFATRWGGPSDPHQLSYDHPLHADAHTEGDHVAEQTPLRFVFYFAARPDKVWQGFVSSESNRIIFAGAELEADLKPGGPMN